MWIYLIKKKSDTLVVFKRFKSMAENQSEHRVKTLRIDRGGEYTSIGFKKFYEEFGITYEITPSYTLQYNGIAERRNKTLLVVHVKKQRSTYVFVG